MSPLSLCSTQLPPFIRRRSSHVVLRHLYHSTTVLFASTGRADGRCSRPELQSQSRDVATVQRLEKAWTLAFLSGDEELERCLLTPDFTEVLSDGSIKHLADELALARNNLGKNRPVPDIPAGTVLLHGNVAAAYGASPPVSSSATRRRMRYVDYYVWENGEWHVYFAQQTFIILADWHTIRSRA